MSQGVCEEKVFKAIFWEYSEMLRNYLYYKSKDLSRAEDIVEDSFEKLWENCANVSMEKSKSYLITLADNHPVHELTIKQATFRFEGIIHASKESQSPQSFLEEEIKQSIEATVSSLPEDERVVFLMNRIDKQSYKEICDVLGQTEQEVATHMHNAMRTLHNSLTDTGTIYAQWLEGDLRADEIKDLKASGAWQTLEGLVKATKDISLPAYDKDLVFDKLKTTRDAALTNDIDRYKITPSTIISAAVSLALLLGAIFFLKEAAPNISARNGETIVHVLPGKSQVTLNDGSSINYDDETWTESRKVKLMGEAFFEITDGKTFIVETNNGMVEVLGTSFNVRAWDEGLAVECYDGQIKITYKGQTTTLLKNQSVFSDEGNLSEIFKITHKIPHWLDGKSTFLNEPLDNVFSELERQYDLSVDRPTVYKNFTGSFVHSDLQRALQQITGPMYLDYDYNKEKTKVIISK